jgi:integrase/recombinase XerD
MSDSTTPVPDPDLLFTLVGDYVSWLDGAGFAPATVRSRQKLLGHFAKWAEAHGITRPAHLTLASLDAYQLVMAQALRGDGRPLALGTRALVATALKRFGKWLVRNGRLDANPAEELAVPRRSRRLPREVLTAEEMERVLAIPNVERLHGLRDRAVLETLYSTGLRRLELIRLARSDVDPARGMIHVREGKGRRDRVVPIGGRALGWINRYLESARPRLVRREDPGNLFLTHRGRQFRANRLSEMVRGYIRAADLGKSGSCHLFRHTMATLLLENGAGIRVVQEILGHAHLASTALYTHVAIVRIKQVHSATHPAERDSDGTGPSVCPCCGTRLRVQPVEGDF